MSRRLRTSSTLGLLLVLILFGACSSREAPQRSASADARTQPDEPGGEAGHDEHADHPSADPEGEHGHDDHEDEHEEGDFARIDPAKAAAHGIQITQAAPGPVAASVALTGRLIIDPRRVALVRARFAGPVRSVSREVGDAVREGDVLAQVESNDSLRIYEVRSPLRGVVLERMTNPGDVAGEAPLFRVGDLTSLQAELKVFPNDVSRVQRGAEALVRIVDREVRGKVINIVPEIDSRTQAMLVRINLTLGGPVTAAPGQFVTGRILVAEQDAAVAIPADALQRFEGQEVVFVPDGEGFRPSQVTVGRRSLDRVEILSGLQAGESYVSAGAFLIKAEIGKAAAGHDH